MAFVIAPANAKFPAVLETIKFPFWFVIFSVRLKPLVEDISILPVSEFVIGALIFKALPVFSILTPFVAFIADESVNVKPPLLFLTSIVPSKVSTVELIFDVVEFVISLILPLVFSTLPFIVADVPSAFINVFPSLFVIFAF